MLLHFPFMCGTPVVIQQRFDLVQFCANVEKYKIAIGLVVPPVLLLLSRHPGKPTNNIPGCVTYCHIVVDKYDMSSLEVLFSAAAPLSAALSNAVRLSFPFLCIKNYS